MASSRSEPTRLAVIGTGRLGGALLAALRRAAIPARGYTRLSPRDSWLARADLIFLTVPDDALRSAFLEWRSAFAPHAIVAHCSGALGLEVLDGAPHRGSLHPLVAVPSPRASLAYAWAAIEGSAGVLTPLKLLARRLGMKPFRVPAENRALYHAAAVLASSGLVAAAAAGSRMLATVGASGDGKSDPLRILLPLIKSAVEGLEREGLPRALTGPVARGDHRTIDRHLAAMKRSRLTPETTLYRAMLGELDTLVRR